MPNVTTTVPNLIGGISQQADDLRYPTQVEMQVNALPSVVDGLSKRPPTSWTKRLIPAAIDTSTGFYHSINRDTQERFWIAMTWDDSGTIPIDLQAFDLKTGTELPVRNEAGDDVYYTDLAYFTNPQAGSGIRALTVADYTFLANTSKVVAAKSDLTPNQDPSALVLVKNLRRGADYKIRLYNSPTGTTPSFSSSLLDVDTDPDRTPASGDPIAKTQGDVCAQLMAAMTGASAVYTWTLDDGTIFIKKIDGSDFRIEVECTLTEGMVAFKDSVQSFSQLPKRGYANFTIRVQGDPENLQDDYYIRFDPDVEGATGFQTGVWRESLLGGEQFSLDPDTLPWVLLNHGTYFELKKATWTDRKVGALDSNPLPSFVGQTISSMTFYKNRLGFTADENIILSEAGEFFNFWRTTVLQLLDSDPIDTPASHSKVSILKESVVVSQKLVLLSEQTQFSAQGGDILTPQTFAIDVANEYSVSATARPIVLGDSAYFPFRRGDYSGLIEYLIKPDTGEFTGFDITSHVPRLIEGDIVELTGNHNEGFLLARTSLGELWVYRFFSKDGEKLQSSWSKWDLGSSVRAVGVINSEASVLVQRADGLSLESLDFSSGLRDSNSSYTTHLDSRVTEAQCVRTYDPITETTSVILPWVSTETTELVTRFTVEEPLTGGFRITPLSRSGNLIVVPGDLSTSPFWAGIGYTMQIDLTRPTIREDRGTGSVPILNGTFQVQRGILAYDDSIYFRVIATPKFRAPFVSIFDNRQVDVGEFIVGQATQLSDGVLKFGAYCKSRDLKVSLVNDSPFPSNFLNLEWQALFTSHTSRV